MKGKFIEDDDLRLAVQLEPESDDERLLLRAFSAQAGACPNRLIVSVWGMGGEKDGLRLFVADDVRRDPRQAQGGRREAAGKDGAR